MVHNFPVSLSSSSHKIMDSNITQQAHITHNLMAGQRKPYKQRSTWLRKPFQIKETHAILSSFWILKHPHLRHVGITYTEALGPKDKDIAPNHYQTFATKTHQLTGCTYRTRTKESVRKILLLLRLPHSTSKSISSGRYSDDESKREMGTSNSCYHQSRWASLLHS